MRMSALRDGWGRRHVTAGHAGYASRDRQAAPGPLVQAGGVPVHRLDVREGVTDRVTNRRQHRVSEAPQSIVNPQSFSTRVDQSGPAEVRQMAGRLGLRNLEALVDVADADLTRQQQSQDAQAGLVCQGFEERLHLHQLLGHISALTNISRNRRVPIFVFADTKSHDMSDIRQAVRDKYGAIATAVTRSSTTGCGGPAACGCSDPITSNLYSDAETSTLP